MKLITTERRSVPHKINGTAFRCTFIMNFKTRNITLDFKDITIKLTVVDNIDELFDALIEKGETHPDYVDQRIPYWAELWASAVAMSEYLVENQHLITPFPSNRDASAVSVTEIGCGLGLPSIVAGKLGAEVCLTDYDKDSLDFAKMNWEQNLPHKTARFELLDWRNPDPAVAADLLLASDVAYEKRAFEPLLGTFKQLLKPNGTILLTEPNREMFRPFVETLHTEGYAVKHSQRQVTLKDHLFLVNIYEINSCAGNF
jgi:predicted nicotinamide N-methyase